MWPGAEVGGGGWKLEQILLRKVNWGFETVVPDWLGRRTDRSFELYVCNARNAGKIAGEI